MAQESTPLECDMGSDRSAIHVLTGFIPVSEVANSLKTLSDGANGIDGLSRADLRHASIESLTAHCNLWLLTGHPPEAFKDGYTTLAPKVAQPTASEHRPITVSTMVARLYHRLLAARLERDVPLNPRQKAFRRGDGLRDNIWILRSLLKGRFRKIMNTCAYLLT
jgi:hypothetical protein